MTLLNDLFSGTICADGVLHFSPNTKYTFFLSFQFPNVLTSDQPSLVLLLCFLLRPVNMSCCSVSHYSAITREMAAVR